jgi:excinuclease ABC subunit C
MDKFKFINGKSFNDLPKTAGVYLFRTKNETIYIGKAINIQNRVKNHFNGKYWWERNLLRQGFGGQVGYLETNSEIEALILEANLIKKYQPKFNVVWKDDKNYFYVAIAQNKQKIPYVFITHQPSFAKASEGQGHKYIGPFIEGVALKKTLRFLRRVFPYYSAKNHPKNKCTYCHLGLCPGPNPDLTEYRRNIKKLILILQGKRNTVLNSLKQEMKNASKENKFEEAGKIRDRIYVLQQIMAHTQVINISTGVVKNFAPAKNLTTSLQNLLGLKKQTSRIEAYDVSNIQGKQATGSMIVFTDGKPDKNQYRKFKIRLAEKPNDIAMLKEILTRRFFHPEWKFPDAILIDGGRGQLNAAIEIKKLRNYFKNLKIKNLKIISIAKGRQELFIEGKKNPIPLKSLPQEIYNLVKQLDDEAHRFAITYHKKLRKKNLIG